MIQTRHTNGSVFLFVTFAVISFTIQSFILFILIADFPRHIFWFSVLFAGIYSFLGFVLWVLLTHVIARNQANYGKDRIRSVAACFASSAAPLLFLVPWLAGIPVVGVVLPIGLIIYQFILAVIAIQAVYTLSIGRAILAGIVMLIATLVSVGMHIASILYFIAPIVSAYSQQYP